MRVVRAKREKNTKKEGSWLVFSPPVVASRGNRSRLSVMRESLRTQAVIVKDRVYFLWNPNLCQVAEIQPYVF